MKRSVFILAGMFLPLFCVAQPQFKTAYPDIPRIDVHIHYSDKSAESLANYPVYREKLKELSGTDIAMWINMSHYDPEITKEKTGGRMLNSFVTDKPSFTGLQYYRKKDINRLLDEGFIGYKIWYCPPERQNPKGGEPLYPYMDDPAHEKAFAELERQGVLLTSLHIGDPNGPYGWRTGWVPDPVYFWRRITGLEHVLHRHPNLKIVVAHAAWLTVQDAQIDYLRYMLDTYPNMNVDICAILEYANLPSYDNLRDFFIEYQDRLIWCSDLTWIPGEDTYHNMMQFVMNTFRFLETGDTFGERLTNNKKPLKGLNLPREVLEKIYYKNAVRIYPPVLGERMKDLGYSL